MKSFVLLLFVLLLIDGCSSNHGKERAKAHPTTIQLIIGLLYDVSGSVEQKGLTFFAGEHIDKMISILNRRGGEMAFGIIDEKAFEPLIRIKLVQVDGRLDVRAKQNQKNLIAIERFRFEVLAKTKRRRDARYTDINGALARFRLFFMEPTIPANAVKIAIFVSDGIDTGPWRFRKISLPQDVQVLAVGFETYKAKQLFGDKVILFEAVDSVIRYLFDKTTEEK